MIIDLENFLSNERVYWDRLSAYLKIVENDPSKKFSYDEITEFYYLYKRAISDLSKVRTFSMENSYIEELNFLVSRAYSFIHGQEKTSSTKSPSEWLFDDMPRSFRRHGGKFAIAVLITFVGMLFGGGVILFDYDSKAIVVPFAHLQDAPTKRVEREIRNQGADINGQEPQFAAELMTHNIKVSVFCLALGLTFGLGTIILLFYNGVILGLVAVDYIVDGQTVFLLGWLLPHGVIEIPAILIAGQIGFILARFQILSIRREVKNRQFLEERKDMVNLFFCLCIMLVWAGIVEAFLSQYHEPVLPYSYKILFGVTEGALFIFYLSGGMGKMLSKIKGVF